MVTGRAKSHKLITAMTISHLLKAVQIPRTHGKTRRTGAVKLHRTPKSEVVERVRAILDRKGLTLYQVSLRTQNLYGRSSPYFVPHNLYYELDVGTFSPSLHQLLALSKISKYRFNDWLRVFGLSPERIPELQLLLPSKRTMVLDSTVDDPESWIPWFRNKPGPREAPSIAPLGQFIELSEARRLRSFQVDSDSFIYAKVGRQDVLAFPNLLPGSIVRVNTKITKTLAPRNASPDCLFLLEHAAGFCCCRLQALGEGRVLPLSTHLPYAQVELKLHEEARILGVLDLEIRPLIARVQPEVPRALARYWKPLSLPPEQVKLSRLLRNARSRMGLSFREASVLSRRIASELGDEQYFAAPGSLSDYETQDAPPRHVQKVITLCAIYGLHFSTFLKSSDLHSQDAGQEPIPDNLVPRKTPTKFQKNRKEFNQFSGQQLLELLRRWEPVPFFLRNLLPELSGLKSLSLHDFFWVGDEQKPLHPLLVNGLILIINRHKKKPIYSRSHPLWQQPLYVVLKRDGTYICGCCSLENDVLVIHSYSPAYLQPEKLRNHDDAEVVGLVVTVARRLNGPSLS
jgi:transcriptional regulator with XRE-family HTH domain